MKGMGRERGGLVTVTFVAVGMSVMIFWQVFMRVLLEGFLAASRTEIIGLARVFALVLRGFDFDFHFADGVNCSAHTILLLQILRF